MDELLMERYALAKERVCEIKEEKAVQMPYLDFFQKTAAFLEKNVEIMDGVVFLGEAREPKKLPETAPEAQLCPTASFQRHRPQYHVVLHTGKKSPFRIPQAFHRHKPDFRSCFYNFPEGYLHTDHDSVLSIHL